MGECLDVRLEYRRPTGWYVTASGALRSTTPYASLVVCAPYDGRHRGKPGRCEPDHGLASEVA